MICTHECRTSAFRGSLTGFCSQNRQKLLFISQSEALQWNGFIMAKGTRGMGDQTQRLRCKSAPETNFFMVHEIPAKTETMDLKYSLIASYCSFGVCLSVMEKKLFLQVQRHLDFSLIFWRKLKPGKIFKSKILVTSLLPCPVSKLFIFMDFYCWWSPFHFAFSLMPRCIFITEPLTIDRNKGKHFQRTALQITMRFLFDRMGRFSSRPIDMMVLCLLDLSFELFGIGFWFCLLCVNFCASTTLKSENIC